MLEKRPAFPVTKFAKAILKDVNLDENGDPILKKKKKKDGKSKKDKKGRKSAEEIDEEEAKADGEKKRSKKSKKEKDGRGSAAELADWLSHYRFH